MKTPAELAARLRKMVLAAQHHYSPTGEPLRSIVVTPEWLEDMADAANALDAATVARGWICGKCGTDRTKEECPQGYSAPLMGQCPMVGTAQNAAQSFGINKI